MIYGIIKYEYDYHASEWYADPSTIEVFEKEEDRNYRQELYNSQVKEFSKDYWEDFDMEIQ